MKVIKSKIFIITFLFVIFGIMIGIFLTTIQWQDKYKGLPLYSSSGMFMYDTSTPEKAIGISEYVFVARINKVIRTEYKNRTEIEVNLNKTKTISNPYTVYEIEVIENIKGDLTTSKPIEFIQYGGINEDKKSYTLLENTELLREGEYYILMANTIKSKNGLIPEASEPNRIISLGENYDKNEELVNKVILQYKNAYLNQVVPPDYIPSELSIYDVKYIEK